MPEKIAIADGIFVVENLISRAECAVIVAWAESLGFGEAPVSTAAGPVLMRDVRDNERVMVDDPARAAHIWRLAEPFVPVEFDGCRVLGVNERLRVYRYDVNQKFHWHSDGFFQRDTGEQSRLTYMIYLNDGFSGGETQFDMGDVLTIVPKAGMALFFRHELWHQGAAVKAGRKYVLRTDVMYSAPPPP